MMNPVRIDFGDILTLIFMNEFVPDGDVDVFELAKQKRLVSQCIFDQSIESSPVYANGVLYIMTRRELYAIKR